MKEKCFPSSLIIEKFSYVTANLFEHTACDFRIISLRTSLQCPQLAVPIDEDVYQSWTRSPSSQTLCPSLIAIRGNTSRRSGSGISRGPFLIECEETGQDRLVVHACLPFGVPAVSGGHGGVEAGVEAGEPGGAVVVKVGERALL